MAKREDTRNKFVELMREHGFAKLYDNSLSEDGGTAYSKKMDSDMVYVGLQNLNLKNTNAGGILFGINNDKDARRKESEAEFMRYFFSRKGLDIGFGDYIECGKKIVVDDMQSICPSMDNYNTHHVDMGIKRLADDFGYIVKIMSVYKKMNRKFMNLDRIIELICVDCKK